MTGKYCSGGTMSKGGTVKASSPPSIVRKKGKGKSKRK